MQRRKSLRHVNAANARWCRAEARAQAERDAGIPDVPLTCATRSRLICGVLVVRCGRWRRFKAASLGEPPATTASKSVPRSRRCWHNLADIAAAPAWRKEPTVSIEKRRRCTASWRSCRRLPHRLWPQCHQDRARTADARQ